MLIKLYFNKTEMLFTMVLSSCYNCRCGLTHTLDGIQRNMVGLNRSILTQNLFGNRTSSFTTSKHLAKMSFTFYKRSCQLLNIHH